MIGFFETRWDRIRLWCSDIQTLGGRDLVVFKPSTADSAAYEISDRGPVNRDCRCQLLFDDFPGVTGTPEDRVLEIESQIERLAGEESMFTHPLYGSYLVKVGKFDHRIDEHGVITGEIEFLAVGEILGMIPSGTGAADVTGSDALEQAHAEVTAAFDAVGIESDLPDRAAAAQESWASSEDVPTRDVMNQTAALASELETMIDEEGLEDDLALFPAYQATILFGDALRTAAQAATTEVPSTFRFKVFEPVSVLALAVSVYGGPDAEFRERQIREMNDLTFVGGLIAAGQDVIMPSKNGRRA